MLKLFARNKFFSLSEALAKSDQCERLYLTNLDFNLKDFGEDLLLLNNLKELYILADPKIYYLEDFELPPAIGMLKKLRVLSLLNLPLKKFPDWIRQLPELKLLILRGTDLTTIPEYIQELKNLKRLRIENCGLSALPLGLSQMDNLRELGLCDTKLTDLDPKLFPKQLKKLELSGTGAYDKKDLEKLRIALKRTKILPL